MNFYLGGTLFIVFFLAIGLVMSFGRGGTENMMRSTQTDSDPVGGRTSFS